jgi:predicted permease
MSSLAWIDWRMLGFLSGISVFTGLLFGILPALSISRLDVHASLKEASGRSGTGMRHNRIRGALVITEVVLAVILLAGATLMIRTFSGMRSADPGFNTANLLTLKTPISSSRYSTTAGLESMVRQAHERIEALPGVEAAACTLLLPTSGAEIDLPFSIEGRTPKEGNWEGDEQWRFVSPGYFKALQIPSLRGRVFDQRDVHNSDRVVVINDALARKYWPKQDPIGQRMWIGHGLGSDFEEPPREIIGIVGSVTEVGLGNGKVPVMYVPQSQTTDGVSKLASSLLPLSWVVRTKGDPLSVVPSVTREFQSLDAQLAPTKILTMPAVIAESTTRENFNVLLLSVFAFVALCLAAVGIYGLMSYAVQQRTQEIGIRMALGANRGTILKLILRQSMLLTTIGTVIGVAAAFGLTRLLGRLIFGLKSTDPLSYIVVVFTLTAVALLAAWVPAQRAMSVDPLKALRQE